MYRKHLKVLWISIFLLFTLSVGTFGYRYFESWSYIDSFYMTLITITTVGFGEVSPLHTPGKILTILLIFFGIILITSGISTMVDFILEGHFRDILRRRKMEKYLKNIKDHYIICGIGQTGVEVVKEFMKTNRPFVAIENDQTHLDEMLENFEFPYIHGNSTEDDVLKRAGIERAKGLLTSLSSDTDNLFVVLSARDLNPSLKIVSRASSPDIIHKMKKAGANYVISPNYIGGLRMASVMLRPSVVNFLDVMMRSDDASLRLEEVMVSEDSIFNGKKLADLQIPQNTGLMVIAIKRGKDNTFQFNPKSDTILEQDDALIVLGAREQMDKIRNYLLSS